MCWETQVTSAFWEGLVDEIRFGRVSLTNAYTLDRPGSRQPVPVHNFLATGMSVSFVMHRMAET